MEVETLIYKQQVTQENRSHYPSIINFDLPDLIEKIKKSRSWLKGELASMILLKNPDKRILLTALHKETEINSFQSNDSVTIQIIEGKLMFRTPERSVILKRDQFLTLHENIEYSITTDKDTIFLLTLVTGIISQA
jgi:hypothetical protein